MDDAVERAIISIGEQYTSEKAQRDRDRFQLARDIYVKRGDRSSGPQSCIDEADEFLSVYYNDKEQGDE